MKIGVGRGGTPVRALNVVSAVAGFFMRAAPAHPSDLCGGLLRRAYCAPLNPHAAGLAASREKRGELSCVETPAFSLKSIGRARGSSGESGVRRLSAAGFFVRCRGLLAPVRCAEMLRPPLPHPQGQAPGAQTWRLIFNKPPYLPLRAGGCVRRGAPSPCPRLPAPPMCLSAEMPPDGRLGGSPFAPAPCVRALPVALLPSAPSLPLPHGRANARPHALAGCFGGLLWGRHVCAHVNGWALSLCRPPFGRSHVRSCPLGIASRGRSIISLCVWSRGALRAPHR